MIFIDAKQSTKKVPNFWNHIHFHPTDAIEDEWGQKILNDVAEDKIAKTVRMYTMFEDIVKEGENGELCYDFSLNDERMDYMVSKGFDLLLIYAYIPPFMAQDPTMTSTVCKNKTRYKGKVIIISPPKDYKQWGEICYQYTKHIVERYGEDTVARWQMQCWNEPDIPPFFMGDLPDTKEAAEIRLKEYIQLYREFALAIKRVSPRLQVGESMARYASFLEHFIQMVLEEKLPLDFVCIHTYGTSVYRLNGIEKNGEPCTKKPFHAENTIKKHKRCQAVVAKYFDNMPIVVDEWGAAAQGFFNREECPPLMFREGSEYAAYMGKMITAYVENGVSCSKMLICLSGQHEMVVDFSGFRNFFTMNHIRKPLYNAFILLRKLYENIVACEANQNNLAYIATKSDDGEKMTVAISYASPNFNEELPSLTKTLKVEGMGGKKKVTVWLIDETHTNPYKLALRNGWGDGLYTEEQLAVLREEGMMKPLAVYDWDFDKNDSIDLAFDNNALVVVEIE